MPCPCENDPWPSEKCVPSQDKTLPQRIIVSQRLRSVMTLVSASLAFSRLPQGDERMAWRADVRTLRVFGAALERLADFPLEPAANGAEDQRTASRQEILENGEEVGASLTCPLGCFRGLKLPQLATIHIHARRYAEVGRIPADLLPYTLNSVLYPQYRTNTGYTWLSWDVRPLTVRTSPREALYDLDPEQVLPNFPADCRVLLPAT